METATPAESKYLDDYASALGMLMANLATLESSLRGALHEIRVEPVDMQLHSKTLVTLPVGTSLAENSITSWRSLGELIREYNELRLGGDPIPQGIRDLRNMFAHGLIFAHAGRDVLHLVRFSKPKDGRVTIEANHPLTMDWLRNENSKVIAALMPVKP